MRISDWSSDVCSSDLSLLPLASESIIVRAPSPIAARELNIVDVASIGESRTSTIPDPSTGSSTVTSGTESKVGRAASSLPGPAEKIGRASCRERVCQYVYLSVVAVSLKQKQDITQ